MAATTISGAPANHSGRDRRERVAPDGDAAGGDSPMTISGCGPDRGGAVARPPQVRARARGTARPRRCRGRLRSGPQRRDLAAGVADHDGPVAERGLRRRPSRDRDIPSTRSVSVAGPLSGVQCSSPARRSCRRHRVHGDVRGSCGEADDRAQGPRLLVGVDQSDRPLRSGAPHVSPPSPSARRLYPSGSGTARRRPSRGCKDDESIRRQPVGREAVGRKASQCDEAGSGGVTTSSLGRPCPTRALTEGQTAPALRPSSDGARGRR
jgi:hypothetical protein